MDYATREKIYAGVLGKIIGVYHGRPVEGWTHERIIETHGEITYFVNDRMKLPIVLPDDDISGTFAFFRALEDNGYPEGLTPEMVGRTWLNYIIEEKTILWWGGLGRSTEHTAFLNLKNGIAAPASGSHAVNGAWLPAQIGAQIFMDAFSLSCPNDPDRASRLVRAAASVSHDGIALDAAVLLATMEAMAFSERRVETLLDRGLAYVSDPHLLRVIEALRGVCAKSRDWREVRAWIAANHGYAHYDGPCHMVPNHLIVLMAFLMAGDDFARSLTIATSAGWDTDCNAGNVGCLNAVRLGLSALDAGPDLRRPVSDFMYVVSSDGAAAITDAVRETRAIVKAACATRGEPAPDGGPKYGFDFPGSTQGFSPCAHHPGRQAVIDWGGEGKGLTLQLKGLSLGVTGSVSTPVFVEPFAASSSFAMVASPTLYSGQRVTARLEKDERVEARLYALYYDASDEIRRLEGEWSAGSELAWTVPHTNGMPLYRLGIELRCDTRFDGTVTLVSVDWGGAPAEMRIEGMLVQSIWNLTPFWTRAWVSSARHLAPDFNDTICISHPEENGIATLGSRDWDDYSVESTLDYSIHDGGGLVVRSRGHRRYYCGILRGDRAEIVRRFDDTVDVLASMVVGGEAAGKRRLKLSAEGDRITFEIDGAHRLQTRDAALESGAAGIVVHRGTVVADGFIVTGLKNAQQERTTADAA
ncbi:ADP-ribosylglycohydrolase family protein [Consotaella aegiceratis]|uniref:ADP-ribosylglycohydrolase family protein n=1 Tax=Consotaella aegiceratis TaxID=3097961 RepID=UPI002F412E11